MLLKYKLYITALLMTFSNFTYAVGSCNSLSDAVVTEKYLIEGYENKIIQTLIRNNTSDTCSFMKQCITPSRNYEDCYGLLNGFLSYAKNKMKSESEDWFYLMYLVLKGPHTDGETTISLLNKFSELLPENITFFYGMNEKYPMDSKFIWFIVRGSETLGPDYICDRVDKIKQKLVYLKLESKLEITNAIQNIESSWCN